jgi:hypothetical protein
VNAIHTKINFSEAPLYLPEIIANYPEISLRGIAMPSTDILHPVQSVREGNKLHLTYQEGGEMRHFVRFHLAKSMANYFLPAKSSQDSELKSYSEHTHEVESNIFAAKLLAPSHIIKKEMKQVNTSKDVVSQLAEIFWVSKTFINGRLQNILQEI